MFQRIKNLLELSKYTIEEIRQKPSPVVESKGDAFFPSTFNPVTIIDLKGTNPFDEYETSELSPNDTTPRNG